MARIWSSGFESNSKISGVEFDNFSTTPTSIVTSPVHSGTYAVRVNPVATTAQVRKDLFTTDQTSVGYMRVYLCIASLPDVNTEIIRWVNSGGSNMARLRLTTSGTLALLTAGGNVIGSASRPLTLNTWYRIEMMIDATTTPGKIEARLDGTQIAAGANSAQGAWMRIDLGSGVAATCDLYFDDMAVNDTSGSYQNTWPGAGKIIHLHPNATGDSNSFSTAIGGTAGSANNYTRVAELTPDDSTSYNASSSFGQEDLFNCTDAGIGTTDAVSIVSVGSRFINSTAADPVTAVSIEIKKSGTGTKITSTPIIPNNNVSWHTNASVIPYLYPITTYLDPDGAVWTKSTLDAMQIGYRLSAAGTNPIRISTVWTLVEYNEAPSNTSSNGAFFSVF